jgi:hypothetical protein
MRSPTPLAVGTRIVRRASRPELERFYVVTAQTENGKCVVRREREGTHFTAWWSDDYLPPRYEIVASSTRGAWRIIPKTTAPDIYRRSFPTREQAEWVLSQMHRRMRYKVAGFDEHGKRFA